MKNLIYLLCIMVSLASCITSRKAVSPPASPAAPSDGAPKFIETITLSSAPDAASAFIHKPLLTDNSKKYSAFSSQADIEKCNELHFKYGILMNLPVESQWNEKLILFLDDWYGIPYRYGGSTKTGIDCSSFSSQLMNAVYGITLPRTSREQYHFCHHIGKKELNEGDLVFFNTTGRLSHVGVYIGNNKFAHASTSSGVVISDLGDYYFAKRYAGSGRIR